MLPVFSVASADVCCSLFVVAPVFVLNPCSKAVVLMWLIPIV